MHIILNGSKTQVVRNGLKTFENYENAHKIAEKLAKEFPGESFFIMEECAEIIKKKTPLTKRQIIKRLKFLDEETGEFTARTFFKREIKTLLEDIESK